MANVGLMNAGKESDIRVPLPHSTPGGQGSSPEIKTSSSAVAKRPRDASCLALTVQKVERSLKTGRYTLGTELNSTRSTLLKVDCCRNRQQSKRRLLPYTVNFVADTVDFVASVYGAKATRSHGRL